MAIGGSISGTISSNVTSFERVFKIDDPKNNQLLIFNEAEGKWVNAFTIYKYTSKVGFKEQQIDVLWSIEPAAGKEAYGISVDPDDGSLLEVKWDGLGNYTFAEISSERSTITNEEIDELFNKIDE